MADFSYTPQFHHLAWVDNVDRVEAGGTNGFNTRFSTIESDLQAVSTVVTQIGAELDELAGRVLPPPTVTLSIAPTLQPVINGTGAWALEGSGSAVAGVNGSAGMIPLTLPDHVRMTSLRVRGSGTTATGQHVVFFLVRVSVSNGSTQNVVVFDTSTVPLNNTKDIPNSALSVVDLANFRYVIAASVGPATLTPVTLASFQLTYVNP